MGPLNSVIVGVARIRPEQRYQLFVEGRQNTIGVRAGGEGRMQRTSFEQIAYDSAKALGIFFLFFFIDHTSHLEKNQCLCYQSADRSKLLNLCIL